MATDFDMDIVHHQLDGIIEGLVPYDARLPYVPNEALEKNIVNGITGLASGVKVLFAGVGAGKTTAVSQVCLRLHKARKIPAFYWFDGEKFDGKDTKRSISSLIEARTGVAGIKDKHLKDNTVIVIDQFDELVDNVGEAYCKSLIMDFALYSVKSNGRVKGLIVIKNKALYDTVLGWNGNQKVQSLFCHRITSKPEVFEWTPADLLKVFDRMYEVNRGCEGVNEDWAAEMRKAITVGSIRVVGEVRHPFATLLTEEGNSDSLR